MSKKFEPEQKKEKNSEAFKSAISTGHIELFKLLVGSLSEQEYMEMICVDNYWILREVVKKNCLDHREFLSQNMKLTPDVFDAGFLKEIIKNDDPKIFHFLLKLIPTEQSRSRLNNIAEVITHTFMGLNSSERTKYQSAALELLFSYYSVNTLSTHSIDYLLEQMTTGPKLSRLTQEKNNNEWKSWENSIKAARLNQKLSKETGLDRADVWAVRLALKDLPQTVELGKTFAPFIPLPSTIIDIIAEYAVELFDPEIDGASLEALDKKSSKNQPHKSEEDKLRDICKKIVKAKKELEVKKEEEKESSSSTNIPATTPMFTSTSATTLISNETGRTS